METATGIYNFNIGTDDVIDVGFLEVDCNEENNSVNIDNKTIRIEDVVGGEWKSCLLEEGKFVACTECVFKNLENIKDFERIAYNKYLVQKEKSNEIVADLFKLKLDYEISNESLSSLKTIIIENKTSSPIVNIEIVNNDNNSITTEKIKKIENILSDVDFAPRMSEINKGNILYNIEWENSDVFVLVNDFNSVCGIVIQESQEEI